MTSAGQRGFLMSNFRFSAIQKFDKVFEPAGQSVKLVKLFKSRSLTNPDTAAAN